MKCNVLVYIEANWIGHFCLLKHTIEGKVQEMIEVTARWGRTSKELPKEFKETRRWPYWKLKKEALERILWRTGYGRGYGSAIRERENVDDADDNDDDFIKTPKVFPFETFAKRNPWWYKYYQLLW